MASIYCPNLTPCEGEDRYENLSSEAPDPNLFFGFDFGNPQDPPALGFDFYAPSCLGICDSAVSQSDADQCARNNALVCEANNGAPGGGPGTGGPGGAPFPGSPDGPFGGLTPDPGGLTTGSGIFPTPPRATGGGQVFSSAPVSCVAVCPDGTQSTFTLPAGYAVGLTQAAADRNAALACPAVARQHLTCPCKIQSFICITKLYDQICSPIIGGYQAPLSFSGSGFPPGINVTSADPAFANSASVFGTPTVAGNFTGTITITDATGKSTQSTHPVSVFGLTIPPIEDSAIPSGWIVPLDDATCGNLYNFQLATAGGVAPITFSTVGAPGWLTVSDGGLISGTPHDAEVGNNFQFDVTMTDAKGHSCTETVNILVKCGIPNPPAATLCTAYSHKLTSCPVTHQPNAWSGTAPPGMTIDPDGTLHGVPTSLGGNSFTVNILLDDNTTCIATGTLTVNPDGSGKVSAIKDAVWTTTTISGDFSSTMAGASGVMIGRDSLGPPWPANPACAVQTTAGGTSEVTIKNCSGKDYTMFVTVDWTLDAPSCQFDNGNPPTFVYGSGWVKIWINPGAGPPNEHVQFVNMGPAYGTGFSGSTTAGWIVPAIGNTHILFQLFDFGARKLTANLTLTPPVPPP